MTKRGDSNASAKEGTLLSLLFFYAVCLELLNTHEQVLHCKKFTKITLRFCEEYYRM